jgi:murein DD-endopeptidase MepM/ murein hydrolase activator NlpD
MQQSLFYGGMAQGNVSTGALNQMSSTAQGSLGNFQTAVGGAQAAASTLSMAGFSSTSAAGQGMLGQVGAMSLTTGMTNQSVAATLGSQMTNPAQSNMLRMLGIETYGANGSVTDVAKIAQQMLAKVFPGRKITPELVQTALRPGGTLNMMLGAYFPDKNMQSLVRDSMVKTAMNGGAYTPNNASTMSKLGLSNTSSNPQAAQMGYMSSESAKANVVRNGQVAGYATGMSAGSDVNSALTGMASAIQPVTDGLVGLASALQTFGGTSGGQAASGILGVAAGAVVGKGGGSPDIGTASVSTSGGTAAKAMTSWPTTSHGINEAYGVKGNWAAGHHTGVDIAAKDGDPVEAFEAGTVKGINTEGSAYGNHVLLDHGNGLTSLYAHLTSSRVSKGDKVTAGQLIGNAGHTGNVHPAGSKGAHLHFEVRRNGGYGHDVDPMPFISGAASAAATSPQSSPTSSAGTDGPATTSTSATNGSSGGAANSTAASGVNIWTDMSGLHASASSINGALGSGSGSSAGTSLGTGATNVAGGSSTSGSSNGVAATGSTPSMTTDSGGLSTLIKAGWRGDALKTAWEVMMAESGGHASDHNNNAATGDNSYGLFQINMLGSMGPARRKAYGLSSDADLLNPDTNARVAYSMSAGGKNWSPWSTYKSGAYSKYGSKWDDLVKTSGLTGYSQGSYDVPKDQAANLHTGEIVLTSAVSEAVRTNMAKGRSGQLSGGQAPQVNIQLTVRGTEAEAKAFAAKVKGYLEDDAMYASLGGITA